ncbi:hypothetical protein [Arthrobacter sp. A2-55]|uniref:hypothetical protein n=1 Tax=Arthrobacter sp. A2-55 TaxID=2897337 RepID=UPI0021CD688C|nr:hypothetical protein [Arthrobacter sp. A2-55]MCU6479081.1 hypothetical protein [Arthrobacter sp. A2-55]
MDNKRRQLLTKPGDTLLLARSAFENSMRIAQWQEATGQSPSSFTFNANCSVPVPIYTEVPAGGRRFSEVNPEAMWHPLFWLPARVGNAYNLPTGPNKELVQESDAVRSIRVALEMSASGLYHPESGWVDILETVGIDVDNPADVDRISEWQAGGVDDLLDSIDLGPYLYVDDDPLWAIKSALALEAPVTEAGWAMTADYLMEAIWDAAEEDTFDEVRREIAIVASLAGQFLGEVPTEGQSSIEFWAEIEQEARIGNYASLQDFANGPMDAANEWLASTRDAFWGTIDELHTGLAA